MPEKIDREQLARYLAGTASSDEAARVQTWLEAHPEMRARLEGLDDLPPREVGRRDPEVALARIQNRMAGSAPQRPSRLRQDHAAVPRAHDRRMPWIRIAVGIVLVVVVSIVGYQLIGPQGPTFRVFDTAAGEQRTVMLEDGTVVHLNVASRLRVPGAFARARREVILEGEAFFEVTEDASRPFVVRTGEAVVHVLGTTFGVDGYDRRRIEVVVVEGRVALRGERQPDTSGAVLERGQLGRLIQGADALPGIEVEQVRTVDVLAWRDGRLVFEGTSLAAVARTLERWYDVEVRLSDPALAARRLDASFDDEPFPDVLRTIAAVLEIDYQIDGHRVLLTPRR